MINDEEKSVRDFIHVGSTSLTDAQRRYSPVEFEALPLQWSASKCHFFLCEAPVIEHYTDSTGVAGLLKKDISEICNPRLQRMFENSRP